MSEAIDLGFDPDTLRNKYREERDKRLRDDGNDQYIEVTGQFSHYIEDPYLDETIEREPLTDEVEIAIIGGGISGLGAAYFLSKKRSDGATPDITLYEAAPKLGGHARTVMAGRDRQYPVDTGFMVFNYEP